MELAPAENPAQTEDSNDVYKLSCKLSDREETNKLDTIDRLISVIEEDLKAADFKWSLFVSASKSFRYDSCLKPYPSMFIRNGEKDIDELSKLINDMPPLDLLLQKLRNKVNLNPKLIDLLMYVLVNLREPYLKTIPVELHDLVLNKVPSSLTAPKPQHIFQVVSTVKSNAESNWRLLSKERDTLFAYHGSRLENYYSIMHYGLQQHLNKNVLYGSGIYLASELSVSLLYGPGSFGWGASVLGSHLSCIAMCEVINKMDGITCQKSTLMEARGGNQSDRVEVNQQAIDSLAGEVPHKYYIVTNNDLIRVRYLLVYAKQPFKYRMNSLMYNKSIGRLHRWFGRHKLLSLLLGYGLMLAAVGLMNNRLARYYFHMFLNKVNAMFNGNN